MTRPLAALVLILAIGASACETRSLLAAPPSGFKLTLAGLLQNAPLVPAPAGAPVFAVIYTLPRGSSLRSPLDVRPLAGGRLPPWTTGIHALQGSASLNTKGVYVIVFSESANTIQYLARVGDPRNVLGETLDPSGNAALVRVGGGSYSARVPFDPQSTLAGFEVEVPGTIARVDYYLPFNASFSLTGIRRYQAILD